MKKTLSALLSSLTILILTCQLSHGQMKTEEFTFEYDGNKYSGLLDFHQKRNHQQ